jgi:aspartate 1-decarboxylase
MDLQLEKYKDDIIIIISYATMEFEAAKTFKPWVIFPNENDNSLT